MNRYYSHVIYRYYEIIKALLKNTSSRKNTQSPVRPKEINSPSPSTALELTRPSGLAESLPYEVSLKTTYAYEILFSYRDKL